MTSSAPTLRLHVFKDSREPMLALLSEYDVSCFELAPKPGAIMASGGLFEIIQTVGVAAAMASVVIAFLKARHGRKVIITARDKTVIHAENLTHDELIVILKMAESVAAIDTGRPPETLVEIKNGPRTEVLAGAPSTDPATPAPKDKLLE